MKEATDNSVPVIESKSDFDVLVSKFKSCVEQHVKAKQGRCWIDGKCVDRGNCDEIDKGASRCDATFNMSKRFDDELWNKANKACENATSLNDCDLANEYIKYNYHIKDQIRYCDKSLTVEKNHRQEAAWMLSVASCKFPIFSSSCDRLAAILDGTHVNPPPSPNMPGWDPSMPIPDETKIAYGRKLISKSLSTIDDLAWKEAEPDNCSTPSEPTSCNHLEWYLEKFPNGAHAKDAKDIIRKSAALIKKLTEERDARYEEKGRKISICVNDCMNRCTDFLSVDYCDKNCKNKCRSLN